VDPRFASPGVLGFLVVFFLAVATWLLIRSMVGHLRKVRYSAEAAEAAETAAAAAEVAAAADAQSEGKPVKAAPAKAGPARTAPGKGGKGAPKRPGGRR
jgi:Na+-transporting methylmalonyl-CoA/oxaloacetate decarboxylase gamma subunit